MMRVAERVLRATRDILDCAEDDGGCDKGGVTARLEAPIERLIM
jgi:hypothetical protein